MAERVRLHPKRRDEHDDEATSLLGRKHCDYGTAPAEFGGV